MRQHVSHINLSCFSPGMCREVRSFGSSTTMSQKNVELIFGRLATDEEFRKSFGRDPASAVLELADRGFELTKAEQSALLRTDVALFDRIAEAIDPRLQ